MQLETSEESGSGGSIAKSVINYEIMMNEAENKRQC